MRQTVKAKHNVVAENMPAHSAVPHDHALQQRIDRSPRQLAQRYHVARWHGAPVQRQHVAQRVPMEAEIVWGITHVVARNRESIFEGKEVGSLGELEEGERLIVDDEDIIVSRRGSNQEHQQNREADRAGPRQHDWYRVLMLKGEDVRSRFLYVRKETFVSSISTGYLNELSSNADMSGWNSGNPDLANAHHKFPKSAIGWLLEHMTEAQKIKLRLAVNLPRNAGPNAVARLRSILISPKVGHQQVKSENRTDDPHNNRKSSPKGEEYLDLVHTVDGSSTPRSQIVQSLAQSVTKRIYLKYKLFLLSEPGEDFFMSDADADDVIEHLRRSEEMHYAIEKNPMLPSHSSTGDEAFASNGNKFTKKKVSPINIGDVDISKNYEEKVAESKIRNKTRIEIINRFFEWLGKHPSNKQEGLVKCDFAGRKGWIVRYIHGDRRGRSLGEQIVDPFWMDKLKKYASGEIGEDEVDEKMPWLQSLFMHGTE